MYYGQGDALVDAYIDFLEATFGNDQKAIDDAQDRLYSLVCKKMGVNKGGMSNPEESIKMIYANTLLKKIFDEHTFFSLSYDVLHNVKGRKTAFMFSPGLYQSYFDDVISALEKRDKNALKKLPEYILLLKTCKTTWNTDLKYYELVALIDGWKDPISGYPGGHFWTYVKDEFDSKHLWYKRDDLNPSDAQHLATLPKLTCPVYALYRKIPGSVEKYNTFEDPLDELGNAFNDMTTSLIF